MSVLIVVESIFGNTRTIADAVGQGLHQSLRDRGVETDVVVADVADAPLAIADDVALLVLGGPTHAFSMSREGTREDALQKAHAPNAAAKAATGMREWIEKVAVNATVPVVTFDTRVKKAFIPGSAAKSAAKALTEHGMNAERGETFWVHDTPGPLLPGERERARGWGATLAERL